MAELATLMGGKGKVAILAGNQNAPNLQNRVKGVKEEAKKYPGISIVGVFNHNEAPQDAAAEVVRVNNAYPEITAWAMIGGWPLMTPTLLTDLNPAKQKVVSVDAMPAALAYVDKGIAPVLLAQPVYMWGSVGVKTLFEKVHDKKDPAQPVMTMDLIRVTKANLGEYAKQLKAWGFTGIDEKYLKM
jgi:ribose transport system substrate-binding protein